MASRLSLRARVEMEAGGALRTWAEVAELRKSLPNPIDLSQGYPDFDLDTDLRSAASNAFGTPLSNQYSPIGGVPALADALAKYYGNSHKRFVNPTTEICVMASGTEVLYMALQALVNPGDKVVICQPYFPWFVPIIRLAGGVPVVVTLEAPDFKLTEEPLRDAITSSGAKICIMNHPHNPTGRVFTAEERSCISKLCCEFDLLCIADEVYDTCVFGGGVFPPLAVEEGMRDRTVTVGSSSKMLSVTGWRVGWAMGPKELIDGLRLLHGYNTFCAPTPLQVGLAVVLAADDFQEKVSRTRELIEGNYKLLVEGVKATGAIPMEAQGGYFLVVDVSGLGMNAKQYCSWLATVGIVAVPMECFYLMVDGVPEPRAQSLVRFTVAKKRLTLDRAVEALNKLAAGPRPAP